MDSGSELQYFLSSKNGIAVISFTGMLSREGESVLAQCLTEITAARPKSVVIVLRDLSPLIEAKALPVLARLQKAIRDLPSELRLCGLHPKLKAILEERGLLRSAEVANNLLEALQSLAVQQKE